MSVHRVGKGHRARYKVRWREESRNRQRTFDTRAEAEAFERGRRTELARRADQGAFAPAEPSAMVLGDWLAVWWDRDGPALEQGTRQTWASLLDVWIAPFLGGVALRELGQVRLRDFRAQIMREGRAGGRDGRVHATRDRANKVMTVLSAALGAAARDGLLPANPCQGIRRLSHLARGHRAWPPLVLETLRAEMAQRDALAVSLMYLAGLRPSEVLGLTWRQVGEVLVIDQSAPMGRIQLPKTRSSGVVRVVAPLAEDLAAWRPAGARRDDLVIPSRQGAGVLDVHTWRERIWRPAVARADLDEPLLPYDGRHTFGSLLIHEGRNILEVQREMRHASAKMTLEVYAHEFAEWELRDKVTLLEAVAEARAQVAAGEDGRAQCRAERAEQIRLSRSEGGRKGARTRAARAAAARADQESSERQPTPASPPIACSRSVRAPISRTAPAQPAAAAATPHDNSDADPERATGLEPATPSLGNPERQYEQSTQDHTSPAPDDLPPEGDEPPVTPSASADVRGMFAHRAATRLSVVSRRRRERRAQPRRHDPAAASARRFRIATARGWR